MISNNPTQYIVSWFIRYIKNKDIMFKKIKNINIKDNNITITNNDNSEIKNIVCATSKDYNTVLCHIIKQNSNIGLIMLNNKTNLNNILNSWNDLTKIKHLTIYFINPFSTLEKKWVINPRTHSLFCDSNVLELGLKTLFESVDEISESEFLKIIND